MFIIPIFQVILCSSIGCNPVLTVENRTHNAANELQGIATHDANGNMTVMPGLKGKYDAWNRLVEVRNADDNVIATYEYNGLNQRIKKTVGGVLTKSFYNENWQEVESVTGSQMTSYIWGLRYIDDLVLREKGAERLYSLADANWNVVALIDATGAVVERMKYDAFGKITWLDAGFGTKAASDYGWNRTFTVQVLDMETGLMLYRNRYYHTGMGRFITRDPIGYEAGDVNVYRYVYNDPVVWTDYFGTSLAKSDNEENRPINPPCNKDNCGGNCVRFHSKTSVKIIDLKLSGADGTDNYKCNNFLVRKMANDMIKDWNKTKDDQKYPLDKDACTSGCVCNWESAKRYTGIKKVNFSRKVSRDLSLVGKVICQIDAIIEINGDYSLAGCMKPASKDDKCCP